MFCPNCGKENEANAGFCANCGAILSSEPEKIGKVALPVSMKDKGTLIFCSHFGALGIDRFYRGQVGLGILKLLTMGGCGIWALIDLLTYELGSLVTDSEGKLIVDRKTLKFLQSNKN
jgi:TM2 domain-containing membrane protein YozV